MTDPTSDRIADTDASAIERQVGRPLITRLHGLLKAVRLYDLSNQAVREQIGDLLRILEQAGEDEVVLIGMGQCFYVNGARIRAEGAQIALFDALTGEFERRSLGGLRFLHGLESEELATFLKLFNEHADPERAASLQDALSAAAVEHVTLVSLQEVQGLGTEFSEPEPPATQERERARRAHRDAVMGVRGAVLHAARTGKPAMRRIKRVVQPVVDSIMRNEFSIVGLTAIKNHDEYTYAHCVNVSILSVAMGHYLGLSRPALANLGVAALLHDIGKITIPSEVLRKPGRLDPDEWQLMERHPLEGLKIVSRAPGLSDLTPDLLNVTFQHHLTYDGGGYPKFEPRRSFSTVARIVGVADCYDAMTAHRAYRARPFTGYEALGLLLGSDRGRYDPAALWALVKTVGLYPAGTLMITDTHHLVISLTPNPEDLRRPHCRVLARPDGSMPPDAQPEMWDPMPGHESVARIVHPEDFEGEVGRLLAA